MHPYAFNNPYVYVNVLQERPNPETNVSFGWSRRVEVCIDVVPKHIQ